MTYIGLGNCMLFRLKTDDILQFNMTHSFIRALCGRCVSMEVNFLFLMRYDVAINITVSLYMTPCSLVRQYQRFTETFSSIRAEY
jgi:hypothetical protein